MMKYPHSKKRLNELAGIEEARERWENVQDMNGKFHPKFTVGVQVMYPNGMGKPPYEGVVSKFDGRKFTVDQPKDNYIMAGSANMAHTAFNKWRFKVK